MNPHRLPVPCSAPYREALEQCLEHWALVAERTEVLRDGVNHVFASEDARGARVIVRVSDGNARRRAELEGELLWLNHLRKYGCPVTTPIRSLNGELVEAIELPTGTYHGSCFASFGGRLLDPKADVEWNEPLFQRLGREIGQFHRVSDMLALPPRYDRKPWFESRVARFPTPLPEACDWDTCAAMQSFTRQLRQRRRRSRQYGLVHGDLHAGTFVYQEGKIELTDFDLGVYVWRTMDFATLLFTHYYLPSTRVPDASPASARDVLAAMVGGYRQEYALGQEQLDTINDMMRLRSIIAYVAMTTAADGWQIALGDPAPTVRESIAWIERLWSNDQSFEIDVRGI